MTDRETEIKDSAAKVFGGPWPEDVRGQLTALNERLPLAEELATLAFGEQDAVAYEAVQRGVFALPRFRVSSGSQASNRRPLFRGDILSAGLADAVWAVEERHVPQLQPPEPVVGEDAGAFIEAEFRRRSVMHHPYFDYLGTVELSEEAEHEMVLAHLHGVMVRIRTVHRAIMLALLPMEFHDCIALSKLLIDELGEGTLAKAHAYRTEASIRTWGGTVDWHAGIDSLEMIAMLNWNLRSVSHPDALWSATGLFCIEWNAWLELRAALLALRRRGVPDEKMDVLVVHGTNGDDGYDEDRHAYLLRQMIANKMVRPEDTAQVLSGIAYQQGLYATFFDKNLADLKQRHGKA
jgi:hypothetical protein